MCFVLDFLLIESERGRKSFNPEQKWERDYLFFFAGKSNKSKKSSSGYEEALGISTPSKEFQ